uniref:Sulfotransferase domain-containing protein n=1 Tax=Clastoptera arizonana TaxID=38151 RepID=A0A1B6CQM9_9HEMI
MNNIYRKENVTQLPHMTGEMNTIVNAQRRCIQKELKNYIFSSKVPIKIQKELIPERGGKPIINIVVTTWRSGSTFIGGVLDSHPGTYHFSEPLTEFKTVQIRGEPLASQAIKVLHNLLNCNFIETDKYLKVSKKNQHRLFTHNTRLWESCKNKKEICFLPEFLTPMCKLFPFVSMKIVHLRLRLIESLLEDQELNLKVVYLVRDPRGTMRSRYMQPWCRKQPDCGDVGRLCADLIDDYAAALRLKQLHPTKFIVVRYEDMSLNAIKEISNMFDFLGLYYSPKVQQFVTEHTTRNNSHAYKTYRDSSIVPLQWRQKLSFQIVDKIQQKCSIAMAAWGYLPVDNESNLRLFNPLVEPFNLPVT